jgi:hypothetical protein
MGGKNKRSKEGAELVSEHKRESSKERHHQIAIGALQQAAYKAEQAP